MSAAERGGSSSDGGRRTHWTAHAALAGWAVLFLLLAESRPLLYDALLQEDRFVEWLTVALFAAAAMFSLTRAIRRRRTFDVLVGAFCLFVAGEEFSWGQRLFGLTPPEAFLEHNRQQELTVHNFADVFGEPKWVLILALAGFGTLLPALSRARRGARLLDRVRATAPPLALVPWFVGAIALLVWYPHPFTAEWVETFAGGLFLLAFMPSARSGVAALAVGAAAALALTVVSGSARGATPAQLACARAEAEALLEDLAFGAGATGRLIGARSVHKRVHTAIDEGYVNPRRLDSFAAAACAHDPAASARRSHAVDPWGSAYWIDMDRDTAGIRFAVYSFGPNRRRDRAGARQSADDIVAAVWVDPLGQVTRQRP